MRTLAHPIFFLVLGPLAAMSASAAKPNRLLNLLATADTQENSSIIQP